MLTSSVKHFTEHEDVKATVVSDPITSISNENIMEPTEFCRFITNKKLVNVHGIGLTYNDEIPMITLSLHNYENSISLATAHQVAIHQLIDTLCPTMKIHVEIVNPKPTKLAAVLCKSVYHSISRSIMLQYGTLSHTYNRICLGSLIESHDRSRISSIGLVFEWIKTELIEAFMETYGHPWSEGKRRFCVLGCAHGVPTEALLENAKMKTMDFCQLAMPSNFMDLATFSFDVSDDKAIMLDESNLINFQFPHYIGDDHQPKISLNQRVTVLYNKNTCGQLRKIERVFFMGYFHKNYGLFRGETFQYNDLDIGLMYKANISMQLWRFWWFAVCIDERDRISRSATGCSGYFVIYRRD
jgi:hypothetical protein